MSYVITSNIALNDRPDQANIFKPYSYSNQLSNTIKIPPNSQVAVESCKINKSGLIVVDRANALFNQYFGVPVGDAARPDLSYSLSQPAFGFCGDVSSLFRGDRQSVNTDDFAALMQTGLINSAFHPSFMTGAGLGRPTCVARRNAGIDFEGYTMYFPQETAISTQNTAFNWTNCAKLVNGNQRTDYVLSAGNTTVSSNSNNGFFVMSDKPITQMNGIVIMNFADANTKNAPWSVGLGRACLPTAGIQDAHTENFAPPQLNFLYGQGTTFRRPIGHLAYDYVVCRIGTTLRIFQTCTTTNTAAVNRGDRDGSDLVYREITYWGAHNMGFATAYDIDTNALNLESIRFTLSNEDLKIEGIDLMGGAHLLTDYTTTIANMGNKNNITFPVSMAKWALYPKMNTKGVGGVNCSLILERVDFYQNYPAFDITEFHKWDWWGSIQERGLIRYCRDLEVRWWNQSNYTTNSAITPLGTLPAKLVVNNGMADYQNCLILIKSTEYGEDMTEDANMSRTLGFDGRGVVDFANTKTDTETTIFSDNVPNQVWGMALFIRLNNFTQRTFNAKQGGLSRIIAHLPRFDNAGNENGALYYQPNFPLYIDLDNPNEILVNQFDLDIVYDNEQLCTGITGKTVICLHIKQKGTDYT